MVRSVSVLLLVAVLLVPVTGGASVAPTLHPVITLSGQLNYDTATLVPHYELEGYILIHPDSTQLNALVGQRVIVVGQETDNPSIFMRKTIEVQEIRSDDSDGTRPDEGDPVIMPVEPGPVAARPPAEPDLIASEPVPYFGTAMVVLFGRIESGEETYLIVNQREHGLVNTPIVSHEIDLSGLVGQRVAAVARQSTSASRQLYHVESAVTVTGDLGSQIAAGEGVIYQLPYQEITLRMNGRLVDTDQPPVLGNSRTLVGLRAVAESLGAAVRWENDTRTAFVSLDGREVSVQPGSNRLTVRENGEPARTVLSDTSAVIVNGRMMVPLRLIAETLELGVQWDSVSWTVDLTRI